MGWLDGSRMEVERVEVGLKWKGWKLDGSGQDGNMMEVERISVGKWKG